MAYSYYRRRSTRRLARKSKNNLIVTLVIVMVLIYAAITWVLPAFIGSVGFIKNLTKPSQKAVVSTLEKSVLAPPVLNIPYEATNTALINITGFGTANSKVKLYIDDDLKDTVTVASDGTLTFNDIPLSLGTNNIYGTTIDDAGKESLPSKTIKLIYDNTKPSLTVNEPEDGKKIQGGDKKVKVSGQTDPGMKVFINGSQTIVSSTGKFSLEQMINEGDNTINIKAVSAASNVIEIERSVTYQP